MTRRTAKNAQADIARAIRAAKQSGAECVEVRRDRTIVILLKAPPLVPADEDALKNGNGNMNWRKLPRRGDRIAFDVLALDGDDLRRLPLSMRKTNLARLLARRPDGIFVAPFEHGEIGPDLYRAACRMGLEGIVGIGRTRAEDQSIGSK